MASAPRFPDFAPCSRRFLRLFTTSCAIVAPDLDNASNKVFPRGLAHDVSLPQSQSLAQALLDRSAWNFISIETLCREENCSELTKTIRAPLLEGLWPVL